MTVFRSSWPVIQDLAHSRLKIAQAGPLAKLWCLLRAHISVTRSAEGKARRTHPVARRATHHYAPGRHLDSLPPLISMGRVDVRLIRNWQVLIARLSLNQREEGAHSFILIDIINMGKKAFRRIVERRHRVAESL